MDCLPSPLIFVSAAVAAYVSHSRSLALGHPSFQAVTLVVLGSRLALVALKATCSLIKDAPRKISTNGSEL